MQENTLNIIEKAGWYNGRKVDIEYAIEDLRAFEYSILDSFKKFYEEFSDIYFICEIGGYDRKIEFYIELIEEYFHPIIQNKYTRVTDCILNPIGSINEDVLLTIDEKGIIYSLYDAEVTIIGKNTEEALDNLCNRPWDQWKEDEKFPYLEWWHKDRNRIMKDLGLI